MKVYVAGKITGCPDYRAIFRAATKHLEKAGHTVLNPAILPDGLEYGEYVEIGLSMLRCCEGIYLLPGWKDSQGAIGEARAAAEQGKVIMGDIAIRDIITITKYATSTQTKGRP